MKRKLIALLAVAVLAGATYVLGYSTLFTVSSVEVMGSNKPITTGITKGEKLARVEPRAISAKIEMLDWVESADVSRNWINGKVVISLTPRTPIAIYKDQVIDSSGSSFVPQGEPPQGLIEINAASIEDAVKAVAFFTLPENADIKRVDVSAPHAPIVK